MGVGRVPNDHVGRAFERLLGLPVAVVVAVLWLVGAVLIATSVLVVYLVHDQATSCGTARCS